MTEQIIDRQFARRHRLAFVPCALLATAAFVALNWPGVGRGMYWLAAVFLVSSLATPIVLLVRSRKTYRCGRCGATIPIEPADGGPDGPTGPWTFFCPECDIRWVTTETHAAGD